MFNKNKSDFKEEIICWSNNLYACYIDGGLMTCCIAHLTVTFGRKELEAKCSIEWKCPEHIVLDKQTNQVTSLKPWCLSAELRDFSINRDSARYSGEAQNDTANLSLPCPNKS